MPELRLHVLPEDFAVCRLPPESPSPDWADGAFCSVTRTPHELSVVCPSRRVPNGVMSRHGWRCLVVDGVLEFSLIGILARLTRVLAEAQVSVFACSTWDTDYLLIPADRLDAATAALRRDGCPVTVQDSPI